MADEIAIKVDNVSKAFKLPHEKQTSIKGALIDKFRGGKRSYEKQEVLRDISFDIKKGEFFGIVGRNGSGKSTLLKLLAGIYSPTSGEIHVNGKLTPFIELGVGFNHELTGRENVYLNGALLGFNRKEMSVMYHDIVAFAELEKFMDQKLKNYSSGMQVRLAFSIAIRAQSDILVLDEVLAVGDEAFQQKCIDVFEKYKASKQTVVLVTHDMESVRRFCNKAMLINKGEIVAIGDPRSVSRKYSELNFKEISNDLTYDESKIKITIKDINLKKAARFTVDEEMILEIAWPKEISDKVKNVGMAIVKNSGELIYGTNTYDQKTTLSKELSTKQRIRLSLGEGKYHIMAGLFGDSPNDTIDFVDMGPEFIVSKPGRKGNESGLVRLESKWL